MKLYMFPTVRLSIIRSVFTVNSATVYVIQVCRQLSSRTSMVLLESCLQTCMTYISVQWINFWWWTDELSETCRVSWQNKFVKLVHLVGFITKNISFSVLIFLLWIFLCFNWNFQHVQVCDCVLPTCYATNHFEGARLATERTPWWWHLRHVETCRRLINVWHVCIFVHVKLVL